MGWRRSLLWSVFITTWIAALAVVAIVGAVSWGQWRMLAEEDRALIDDGARGDSYSGEGTRARADDAKRDLASINLRYTVTLSICGVVGAALLGAPFAVRRWVSRPKWPTRAAWLLAVPLVAGLVVLGLALFAFAMRGAITG